MKIAYELTHHWLGERYADDPAADSLRRWLVAYLDGAREFLPVEFLGAAFFLPESVFPDYLANRVEHVAVMLDYPAVGDRSRVMACHLRLFNVLEAAVVVTAHPARYGHSVGWDDAFVFDPVARSVTRCHRNDVDALLDRTPPVSRSNGRWRGGATCSA